MAAIFTHLSVVPEDEIGIFLNRMWTEIGIRTAQNVGFVQSTTVDVHVASLDQQRLTLQPDHPLQDLRCTGISSQDDDISSLGAGNVVDIPIDQVVAILGHRRNHARLPDDPDAYDKMTEKEIHEDGPEQDERQSVASPFLAFDEARVKKGSHFVFTGFCHYPIDLWLCGRCTPDLSSP